jgi:O-antigen/teichoic acid export membrane protein
MANLIGQGWLTLLNLIAVPLYIRLMGIESYGLIGFYTTLQTLVPLFDFGIAPTMNREMARYSVQPEKINDARDFVRTVEVGYWLIGLLVGGALFLLAPWLASDWIKPVNLSLETVKQAVMLMSVALFLQFPFGLYQHALLGLQRQVALNALLVVMTTLRIGGSLMVLMLSPTIVAFLVFQTGVSGLQLIFSMALLWHYLASARHVPQVKLQLLRGSWQFTAGMAGLTISALILGQIDKIILSRLLTLEMFGYYSLATFVVTGITVVSNPVFNTFFPRFSSLVIEGDERVLRQFYHLGAQLMAVLVLPLGLVIALFSPELIWLWTGNMDTMRGAASIASILAVGTSLNSLMLIPYALRSAYGWTSLGLFINFVFLLIMIPSMLYMANEHGAIGVAIVLAGINVLYIFLGVFLTHHWVLKGEVRLWFREVGVALLSTLIIVSLVRQFLSLTLPLAELAIGILGAWWLATLIAGLLEPQVREWFMHVFSTWRYRFQTKTLL